MIEHALAYAGRGWRVFPCKTRGKTPRTKHGHNDATTDAAQIRAWWDKWPDANIGLATGSGLAVVDIDDPHGFEELEARNEELPETLEALTGSGGRHLFYRYKGEELRSQNAFGRGVDLKADGGYVIAPPSVHPSGGVYTWDTTSAEGWLGEHIAPLPMWVRTKREAIPKPQSTKPAGEADLSRVVEALKHIPSDERETWVKVGMAIHHETGGSEEGFSLWRLWSMTSPKFDEKEQVKVWNSFGRGAKRKTIAAVFAIAKEHGFKATKASPKESKGLPVFDHGDEQEIANYLLEHIETKGQTVADLGALWQYGPDGGLWHAIEDEKGRQMVGQLWGSQVVKSVTDEGEVETRHLMIGKSKRINTWDIIYEDRRREGFFGAAPATLVFEDCVMLIDEGGKLRSEDHHERYRARVGYPFPFAKGKPSRWLDTLSEWFSGDADAEQKGAFLQEFAGACLFGLAPRYQRAVILYGKGGNGKSTCLDALEAMFPIEAVSHVSPHAIMGNSSEYYLAQLRDSRINVVRDMPASSLLQSADFKAAVSGEPLMGRQPGANPFKFSPKAGHMFGANTLPATKDQSLGFWRRWVVVPFLRRFEVAKGCEDLARTIVTEELPQMVTWAVEGAARLSARGHYELPESHHSVLDFWASSVNPVKAWLEEACTTGADQWTKAGALYMSHKEWCSVNGFHAVSSRKFGERLDALGIERATRKGARGYRAIVRPLN